MRANKSKCSICFPQDAIFIEQPYELQHGSGHNSSGCSENSAGRATAKTHNSTVGQARTVNELASILQALGTYLETLASLCPQIPREDYLASCVLFRYQLLILLAFYEVLLESVTMEHLIRGGSMFKRFPFTLRITIHFQRPLSASSSQFYDRIVVSALSEQIFCLCSKRCSRNLVFHPNGSLCSCSLK